MIPVFSEELAGNIGRLLELQHNRLTSGHLDYAVQAVSPNVGQM